MTEGQGLHVALQPLLLQPALCAKFGSMERLSRDGAEWLEQILNRIQGRLGALLSRVDLSSEIRFDPWPSAQERLKKIDAHLQPVGRDAIERSEQTPYAQCLESLVASAMKRSPNSPSKRRTSPQHFEAGRMT